MLPTVIVASATRVSGKWVPVLLLKSSETVIVAQQPALERVVHECGKPVYDLGEAREIASQALLKLWDAK